VVGLSVLDRIIATLKMKGMSQVELAAALKDYGVTKQTVTDWKSGKSNTYYSLIAEIAGILEVSSDYLFNIKKSAPDGTPSIETSIDELSGIIQNLSDEGRRQLLEHARLVEFREASLK